MLKGEQERSNAGEGPPLTYGSYLRVPELLQLQSPLSTPEAHDEMLFIVVQQVQELWFKQILHELRAVIGLIERSELTEAVRLMCRVNRILAVLGEETAILETMPPQDFHLFRHVLVTSSGFESEQFRELELASGLKDPTFLKLMDKHMDLEALRARWPSNLHRAFCELLGSVSSSAVDALVCVYRA